MSTNALFLRLATATMTLVVTAPLEAAETGFTNSLGMKMQSIPAGTFIMGSTRVNLPHSLRMGNSHHRDGDFDERPHHRVTISKSFHMATTEVTNAQFEAFAPSHRNLRGKFGFAVKDDEAVVFVSWHEAVAFTRWLSKKEGRNYRLPTEAEWEYVCRAGTDGPFFTGITLPDSFQKNVGPDRDRIMPSAKDVGSLETGKTPVNPWGMHDMHGNVEEWCHDWYGPYELADLVDPLGRVDGNFRVTRGGSHSTELFYLRSANRSGTLPDEKNWLIGFRIVAGTLPQSEPLPVPGPELYQRHVSQQVPADITDGPDSKLPYFRGPRRFVHVPSDSYGPRFSVHNHVPAIVACPNGDLLAVWYSCINEVGRELCQLISRLRKGADEWEPASPFWDAPDRNDHAPGLWFDGNKTIYHFSSLSFGPGADMVTTVMRTSTDNGVTWSKARRIVPEYCLRNSPVGTAFRSHNGTIVLPMDVPWTDTCLWLSDDEGQSWRDAGGTIRGLHAGVVELSDGRWMALSREHTVNGQMPVSISVDRGRTWTMHASPFPPITSGQRLALFRLREGPIFFASYAHEIQITDVSEKQRPVRGLFAALSGDEGKTWDIRRLISDDGPGKYLTGGAWTLRFLMSHSTAEPRGYLSICQTPNGLIHLISSAQHYTFNLAWLQSSPPTLPQHDH